MTKPTQAGAPGGVAGHQMHMQTRYLDTNLKSAHPLQRAGLVSISTGFVNMAAAGVHDGISGGPTNRAPIIPSMPPSLSFALNAGSLGSSISRNRFQP